MSRRIVFCVLIVSFFSLFGYAQTVTMSEFLESMQQSHPFFVKESLSPQIEMKGQERYLGAQDWSISVSPYYVYQKPASSGLGVPEEISIAAGEISAEKALWSTGGRFSVSWTSDYTNQEIPDIVIPFQPQDIVIPAGPARLYTNKLYLMYSQPLLQNYGGTLDRLSYELSDYTVDFTKLQALENQEGFVLDIGMRFLDWTLLSEQNRIANERLALAEEQLRQIKRRWVANLVEKVDVLRAEDAVRIAQQAIVLLESQWKAQQAALAVLAQSRELYTQSPEYDLYNIESLPEPDEAVLQLRERSRLLGALNARREQLAHARAGFAETSRPQLFLSIGAGLQRGDEEFTSSFELDKPDVLVALDFRYPLGNRTAKADVAKTDLEIKQLEKAIEDVGLDLEAGVRSILISINEMEKVLVLNQEQIESARARTREEQKLYNQGRSDLAFVIQSQDNEEVAELTYAENAATYHKLVLQYHALMDEFLNQ